MALNLKTPGVYTQEISLFPPSIAAVETAIPAFIGYTQIPGQTADGLPVPVRITSLLEYESIFGFADEQQGISAVVEGTSIKVNEPSAANKPKYLMHYSIQMYFANGGGPCYISSVGDYTSGIVELSKLQSGLSAIEKVDEPTLLVFPDATSMNDAHFYTIYKEAIGQCQKLKDRFTIMDTFNDNPIGSMLYDPIAELRNGMNLTTDYLKYGAAYYPFLSTIIPYRYADLDVAVSITPAGAFDAMVQEVANTLSKDILEDVITEFISLATAIPATDQAALDYRPTLITSINGIANELTNVRLVIAKAIAIANEAIAAAPDPNASAVTDAKNAKNVLNQWITNELVSREFGLTQAINALNAATDRAMVLAATSDAVSGSVYMVLGIAPPSPIGVVEDVEDLKTDITYPLLDLKALLAPLSTGGTSTNTNLAAIKGTDNVLYNQIKAQISLLPLVLPPSAAMAGVYARVDNDNGVWTAPANVGLNYVLKPTQAIDNDQQEDLNVTATGKSVNAIRAFIGRGTLVWGARTLAGNDNEWKYISVRRLFLFLEESISEASEPFVFKPNDANTWVKMRGMIESFLINQWKAGALAGSTAEQAFYVRVGLGETMTAQDILDGHLIIEIGLAAVRPAEFIVLKFSHKMQEA